MSNPFSLRAMLGAVVAVVFCHSNGYAQSPPPPAADGWIVLTTTDPEGAPPPYFCVAFVVPVAESVVNQMPWGANFRVVVGRYGPYDSMASAKAGLVAAGWMAAEGRVAVSSERCR